MGEGEERETRTIRVNFSGMVLGFNTGNELGIERRREERGFKVSEEVFEDMSGDVGVICEGVEGRAGES